MNDVKKFLEERERAIESYPGNHALAAAAASFSLESIKAQYSYNFDWAGLPIIQYPQDMIALQEIIWKVKPDLIIECGVARGGSLLLSASMLAMIEYCDAVESGSLMDPASPGSKVIGIDIDIRAHNRDAIETHPLSNRIDLIEGSSVDDSVVSRVRSIAESCKKVLVLLDSNHTHDHVLAELQAYASFTSPGSYCIVFDTIVEDLPDDFYADRPWGVGDNPKTAVAAYLEALEAGGVQGLDGTELRFRIDKAVQNKLLVTVAPDGYLERI